MDTGLLKNFLVLAKTKNFTRASERLCLSQSALSLQMVRLENLLGKQLFFRNQRTVSLTVEGEQLLSYAHQMLEMEKEMLHHFHRPQIQGKVSFGTPEDLASTYLPKILSRFVETNRDVLLNVHCEFTVDLLRGFEAGKYDLVLIKQDPSHSHPGSEGVWNETLVWVAKKGFSLKKGEPLPLVLAPDPCVYRARAIDALNQKGIRWTIVYSSPSVAGEIAAVKAGLGVSVLAANRVPKELEKIEGLPALKEAQIALLKKEGSGSAVSALADYISDHISP